MLRNYLLTALRQMHRTRLYTGINVLGLSLGLGCCLLIFILLQHENSYDRFHLKQDRLFQVSFTQHLPMLTGRAENPVTTPLIPMAMPQAVVAELPEVVGATAYNPRHFALRYEDKLFKERVEFVRADFLEMFSFPLVSGSPQALQEKQDAILSQSLAQKLFGQEDPLGQTIELFVNDTAELFTVKAVIEDAPSNTNLSYNLLLPLEAHPYYEQNIPQWSSNNTLLIVEMASPMTAEEVNASLDRFYQQHWGQQDAATRQSLELPDSTQIGALTATPLGELHLSPETGWQGTLNPQYGRILGGIALLILIIATINYVTLSMAQANRRLREIGVRKTLGAYRVQVIGQLLGEAVLLALLAMVFAGAWVELALPYFDDFLGQEVDISLMDKPYVLLGLLVMSLLVGTLAGLYPAFFMASFSPADILKGQRQLKLRTGLTQVLVVMQYSLTLFLIVSSLLMNRQMRFISEKDLGFNQDQIVAVPTNLGWTDEGERLYQQMQAELGSHPEVLQVSGSSLSFGHGWSRYSNNFDGRTFYAYAFRVDPHYLPTLKIQLKQGENFLPDRLADSTSVIINETLARQLELGNPVGENLPIFGSLPGPVIRGVVKDYHIFSLDQPIEPVVLHMHPEHDKLNYLYFKIAPQQQAETVDAIRAAYQQFQPNSPFEHYYLDKDLARQYEAHQQRTELMQTATGLAILIACLGLFALASLSAANRTKEISIRKVFGADLWRLLLLLNRDILLLALIAFAIGAPLAAYFMQDWLAQFAFRIEMEVDIFAWALLIGVALALATVSYQVLRVALTRPAEALRHE